MLTIKPNNVRHGTAYIGGQSETPSCPNKETSLMNYNTSNL